jgi:GNAT superfamily N-acetyltransferase
VEKSLDNSLCFSLLEGNRQIGFARVISDRATFAYLADVFVLAEYRGKGLAKWMIECILNHSELQGLRRWLLATRDAHELYRKYGFTPLKVPDMFMERLIPNIYQR